MVKATKIGDKLAKVSENITVYFYDNAYMVEAPGRDKNDDWCTVKLMCTSLEEVQKLLLEVDSLPREG